MNETAKRPELFVWAKAKDEYWMPLWLHLFDTMEAFRHVWNEWCPPSTRAMLAEDLRLSEPEVGALVQLLFGLHDIGKASPDFGGREQIAKFAAAAQYQQMIDHGFRFSNLLAIRKGNEIRHERLSAAFLVELFDLQNLPKNAERSLLAPIAMHHGHSHREAEVFSRRTTSMQSVLSDDPVWNLALRNTVELVVKRNHLQTSDALALLRVSASCQLPARSQILLGGLMRMADWLASTENFFPLVELNGRMPLPEDADFLHQRYVELSAAALGLVPQGALPNPEVSAGKLFAKGFGFSQPNVVQREFWQALSKADPANLFILEAPMGHGKTEAALIGAQILAAKSGSSGFFFGLPTRATADAIYNRVHTFLTNLKFDRPTTLALHHGAAAFSEVYRGKKFESRTQRNPVLQEEAPLMDEGWLHGANRRILNEHVVGTIDAFLMLALKHKNAYWKHLGFASKVIILDEVHAADEYMTEYLCRALEWAARYRRPVIMLSATLTDAQRERYLAAYTKGKVQA